MPTEPPMADLDIDPDAVDHFIDLNNPVDRLIRSIIDAVSDARAAGVPTEGAIDVLICVGKVLISEELAERRVN
jgi:hypothetical protein